MANELDVRTLRWCSRYLRGKARRLYANGRGPSRWSAAHVNEAADVVLEAAKEHGAAVSDFPPFGTDPEDSRRLERLRRVIDDHLLWPSDRARERGAYEAAVRHSGRLARQSAKPKRKGRR